MIKKDDLLTLGLSVLIMLAPLFVFYVELPHIQREIPIHWGLEGPDRFISPGQFPLLVAAMVGVVVIVWGARFVYPLRQNVDRFRRAYNGLVFSLSLLLSVLLSASVQWAAGEEIMLENIVYAVVGVALVIGGALMYVSRRNWAAGFRNPWTLSSDRVWETVNKEAGLFTTAVGALAAVAGICGAKDAVFFLLFILLAGYAVFTVHSYVLWRREGR